MYFDYAGNGIDDGFMIGLIDVREVMGGKVG